MDGIINVYKEKGFTSHDVVAKLRGILHMKKIGHTGTLDPAAEGVLPICLGTATKKCDLLMDEKKTYVAYVRLGIRTDTLDMEGTVLEEREVSVTREDVEEILPQFHGEIQQIPPMYSALKVKGKRLYDLARQGIEVERKPRTVHIFSLKLLGFHPDEKIMQLEVTCSKGTYIRTLADDMGERLGCGACLKYLLRTRVGMFQVEDALKLSEIQALVQDEKPPVLPTDIVFQQYPALTLRKEAVKLCQNGNPLGVQHVKEHPRSLCKDGIPNYFRLYDEEHCFYAIYEYCPDQRKLQNIKMFYRG